ncbi:CPBP family intramembrane glutamic endopeptidase [Actinopolymorpha pittospori]|uniref:Membrane protease YdiL (CAAX protease family) n=1 Tax=Actinopolymorpha pittospori TaxID=648752 RepID=A0A927R6R2_9ACTN|nr:type II CAAX endopeptidase family protein [Actinopolymorpha pittospori]MBE1604712.1 membrane protease YdiL (CAAX protease family) [Actinopolymorpha pittospori]
MHFLRKTGVVSFGALTFGIAWIPWIVLAATHTDISTGTGAVVFAVAASGPSIAAVALWLRRPGVRIAARTRPRVSWACLALMGGALSPAAAAVILDPASIATHASSTVASVGGWLGVVAYTLVSGPLSEEFGWRGYLQPRLRLVMHHPLALTAVIGATWACWHLPLFFVPGTRQHDDGLLSYSGLCLLASFFPLSFVALLLTERLRGGVPAAILLHAAWNMTGALMPPTRGAGAVLQLAVLVAVALLLGAWWRRHPAPTATPALWGHGESGRLDREPAKRM